MKKTELFRRSNTSARRIGSAGYLAVQDALELVSSLRSEVIDLVFLDPPFNLGKSYNLDNEQNLETMFQEQYGTYLDELVSECVRVMKDGASLFLYHIPQWAIQVSRALERHLQFRHWIAISMKNGFARGERLYPAHYALLYYSKGSPAVFSRPRLDPLVCRHCGEFVRDYGGYRAIIEEQGVNLSDIWDDLSPVRHAARKHRVANELPREMTDRIVSIAGSTGGWFLDPFAGSGTAVLSAREAHMHFVAGDLSEEYARVVEDRLSSLVPPKR